MADRYSDNRYSGNRRYDDRYPDNYRRQSNRTERPGRRDYYGEDVRRRPRRRRRRKRRFRRILLIAVLLILTGIVISLIRCGKGEKLSETGEDIISFVSNPCTVDGYDINDYTKQELSALLKEKYSWDLRISCGNDILETEDFMDNEIDRVLDSAYAYGESKDYSVKITDTDSVSDRIVEAADEKFSHPAVPCTITDYDAENGKFIYEEGHSGRIVDTAALKSQVEAALKAGEYTGIVSANLINDAASGSVADYKKIGTYTTTTTKNKDRNVNVSLACQAVCGTILQPGEQFSYNGKLGRRTAEKGYKEAGAYANGEHVMEFGGGVCQLSSTLYNAAVSAGLQVDSRVGHTFEPSYVTPGEDAAVSYENPDFKFTNNTNSAIGIKVSFYNYTVTAEIYGMPVLPEGVKRYLRSEKTGENEPPMPNYIEDLTLLPGAEVIEKNAKPGTVWKTWTVEEKDGQVISEEYLHTTSYKGTGATIRRNTLALQPGFMEQMVQQQSIPQAVPEPVEAQPAEGEAP